MTKEYYRTLYFVGIYIYQGKAYLPAHAQFESGIFVDIEPVYVSEIEKNALAEAIQSVRDAGIDQIPNPKSHDEFRNRKDPILSITGARSWKQLEKTGVSYSITWTKKEVRIDMSKLDKKGRWVFDLAKVTLLPPDSPLENIVEIIIDDIKTRPEVIV